jgi:hypothetical protein
LLPVGYFRRHHAVIAIVVVWWIVVGFVGGWLAICARKVVDVRWYKFWLTVIG